MRVGRYAPGEVIGVGSFATVHRAQDPRLDDTVVVKVLAENHSLNPEIRERFIAEGRNLRRVRSPHVVTVHDIGETDRQQPYLVLEHADGGTLAERVARLRDRGRRLRREDLLALARSLAAAVAAVHRVRLVHRDLSPTNLLLASAPSGDVGEVDADPESALIAPGERLLLGDLGMCKDLAMNSGLTVSGGTAGFRPPEQDGPGLVDIRADIWAMSAVLCWAADGAELTDAQRQALDRVIGRGLRSAPQRRQADASGWLDEVEQALRPAEPVPAPESSGAGTSHPGRRRRSALKRAALAGGVGVLLVAISFVAGLILGAAGEEASSTAEDASLGIDGPTTLAVGEQAAFTAEVDGVDSWVWVLPTGAHVSDEEQVELTPTSAGGAELLLRARIPGGTQLETRHTIRVVE